MQLKDMDNVFGRNLGESTVEEFERAEEKECEKCWYRGICRII
jgi:radical SAM protein with 4Fe4S-binding SPASM domain